MDVLELDCKPYETRRTQDAGFAFFEVQEPRSSAINLIQHKKFPKCCC